MKIKNIVGYFTLFERILWTLSVVFILTSFFMFDRENYLALASSLVGVTSLVFCAKGNPVGQALIIVFSLVYGMISFSFEYYGEMITYLGMTAPMALLSLVAWLKHPYMGKRSEVQVSGATPLSLTVISIITLAVTVVFYFILKYYNTANLIFSTISVTTSFFAVSLTFLRSPYYALAYAANDIVLIIMWSLATAESMSYISMVICFIVFLINDLYGFHNWTKMKKRQSEPIA